MGASSTVEAQTLANAANLAIADQTNTINASIANANNEYNRQMQIEQNNWNLEQWHRENEYNDPSAQVERLMKAGINPLWAIGSVGSAGTAQHLESADAKPAEELRMERAHVEPEYDPYLAQHIGNIIAAARDVNNNALGWFRAGNEAKDVDTRRASQITRSDLDRATAAEVRATTAGKEIENDWNLTTFDIRANEETEKLHKLQNEVDNIQADTKERNAKISEIEENKKLIQQKVTNLSEELRFRAQELDISRYNARTGRMNAETNKNALDLEGKKFQAQLTQWDNQNLLNFLYKFGKTDKVDISGEAGAAGFGVKGGYARSETTPADVEKAVECGIVLFQRYAEDPSNEQKSKDAQEAAKILDALLLDQQRKQTVPIDKLFNSTNSSIPNPFDPWQ